MKTPYWTSPPSISQIYLSATEDPDFYRKSSASSKLCPSLPFLGNNSQFLCIFRCQLNEFSNWWLKQILAVPRRRKLAAQQQQFPSGRPAVCHQSRASAAHRRRSFRKWTEMARFGSEIANGCSSRTALPRSGSEQFRSARWTVQVQHGSLSTVGYSSEHWFKSLSFFSLSTYEVIVLFVVLRSTFWF